jgi:hypothetical protein
MKINSKTSLFLTRQSFQSIKKIVLRPYSYSVNKKKFISNKKPPQINEMA